VCGKETFSKLVERICKNTNFLGKNSTPYVFLDGLIHSKISEIPFLVEFYGPVKKLESNISLSKILDISPHKIPLHSFMGLMHTKSIVSCPMVFT